MNDTESSSASHLGFRLAVGLVGLALIALFIILGSAAMKQAATTEALTTQESRGEAARPASTGE